MAKSMPLSPCSAVGRTRRIRKQDPECLLSCRARTWRHGVPDGAPPPKRSVIMEFAMTSKETDSPTFASDAERWAAVRRKDRDADGVFFYSVRTTGVYCRPSCAARLARRENVRFHAGCEEAEAAGFRPCKRCRPNEAALAVRRAAAVAKACRLIETAEEMPNLDALAGSAGMSRFHFHRALLCQVFAGAGDDADPLPLRGQRRGDPLRRRRMFARLDSRRRHRQRRLRHSPRRQTRGAGARARGSLSQGDADRRRQGLRAMGG